MIEANPISTTSILKWIEALLAETGFEIAETGENLVSIRDPDSRVLIQAALEGDVVFFTVPCITVDATRVTPEIMRLMLAADNGISTSNFQLYQKGEKQVSVTLNNFCKLQSLESDDQDDVLSCLSFMLADVVQARTLLVDLL